jgi:hypothetical protein
MDDSLGGNSCSRPTGQAPSGLVATRFDQGRAPSIRCDGCGRFIGDDDLERSHFEFTPLNEFGPEESSWLCPRCITKGL